MQPYVASVSDYDDEVIMDDLLTFTMNVNEVPTTSMAVLSETVPFDGDDHAPHVRVTNPPITYDSRKVQAGDAEVAEWIGPPLTHTHSAEPYWSGKATPSLSSRIFDADLIVRANFVSAGNGTLRFTVLEYLKGSGTTGTNIDVTASTDNRTDTWDSREGILFLSTGTSEGASRSALTYNFIPEWRADDYQGTLKKGYSIDRRNPVWLPSSRASGTYIIESSSPAGVTNPTTTLADLRTAIAWQANSAGVANYDTCVVASIGYEQRMRDFDAQFGAPSGIRTSATPFSVDPQGERGWVVQTFTQRGNYNLYDNWWLTGTDANMFRVSTVDDDSNPNNGYTLNVEASRPLPAGLYHFQVNAQSDLFQPCNYIPARSKVIWNVTVPTTPGVVHDALFDPVALTSGGVGMNETNGTLSPANVTIGSTRTSLKGLKWEANKVVLTLTQMVTFTNHKIGFIGTDGTSVLQLLGPDAVADNTAKTLTWDVATQPWQAGDALMLRITPHAPPPPDTPTPEPTP